MLKYIYIVVEGRRMADFFKSAFGYLSNNSITQDNDFVGQYVELGNQKLRVKRVIAEGTF